jgi:uncharacterized membrane protein YphA (DoxX/SURF4 family)
MNTVIWILQGLAAVLFLMAGIMKLSTPYDKLKEKMPWAENYSAGTVKFIGAAELLGAAGLILPAALGILPVLTILAAFALAMVMFLAICTHSRRKEKKEMMTNLILMILVLAVALLSI